ncbi:hypothetical protein [Photobacterium lutimaris]|uniref:DUF4105 domain-containing protein n=1 Tax=Photobacterium lutimaris TaxID=388278 RepID=A0A2T3J0K7_9GAMM|nr:hypothetical protein [Photobacterium lutimaris]PSU34611.1 hypothetical protein C9I99_05790 [Photobacterium lutimaris]TDR71546.1 hypothetical protein DFP78_11680 [Photobacterium lutimaris]
MMKNRNYYLWLFITFLLLSFDVLADYKKVDKGAATWDKNDGYYIVFVARDYVPGHAFVIWSVRDRINKEWKESLAFGLYPKSGGKDTVFGTVPGKLKREGIKSISSINNGLAVAVSKKMYDYSLMNTKAIRTGDYPYNLSAQNCVHFTDMVARSISLKTPNVVGIENHPQKYIAKLLELND